MNKDSSIEAIDVSNLTDQTKFKLTEIMKLKTFNSEIQEGKIMSKKLSKYIVIILTRP